MSIEKSRKELLAEEYRDDPVTIGTTETIVRTTELKSIGTTVTTEQVKAVDRALDLTRDLMSPQCPKGWYAQCAYRMGADRYLGMASDARKGRTPAKLFSYMLKRA